MVLGHVELLGGSTLAERGLGGSELAKEAQSLDSATPLQARHDVSVVVLHVRSSYTATYKPIYTFIVCIVYTVNAICS